MTSEKVPLNVFFNGPPQAGSEMGMMTSPTMPPTFPFHLLDTRTTVNIS